MSKVIFKDCTFLFSFTRYIEWFNFKMIRTKFTIFLKNRHLNALKTFHVLYTFKRVYNALRDAFKTPFIFPGKSILFVKNKNTAHFDKKSRD